MWKFTQSVMLIVLIVFWGCGEKTEVQVSTTAPQRVEESGYTIVRTNANLLKRPPKDLMDKPISIRMINQGDQIQVLSTDGNWSRVLHVLSGQVGYLNNSFIQYETRSKWWSGDTDRAREVAEKIYKDKIFLQRNWPVIHISIEERWNKLVFTLDENAEFPKDQAVECAKFAIEKLKRFFPDWRDHQVFIDSVWNGKHYSMVMGDNLEPTFF